MYIKNINVDQLIHIWYAFAMGNLDCFGGRQRSTFTVIECTTSLTCFILCPVIISCLMHTDGGRQKRLDKDGVYIRCAKLSGC